MQNKQIEFRTKCILACILIVITMFLYYLITQTGIVPGANKDVDTKIAQLKQTEEAKQTREGQFVDRNGEPITVAEEAGEPAICIYPEEYSPIIGYNSNIYGTSGLRKMYAEDLFIGGKDGIGATIRLTIDNSLQQFCYRLLNKNEGSIVILDNKNAEILAMSSRSNAELAYDVNQIDTNYELYNAQDAFFFNRAVFAQDPPGSTWKIITSASMIENGEEDYIHEDTGEYNGIKNAGNAVYGSIDLQNALITSCNTFFASAGTKLGGVKLGETAGNFYVGETIPLDFTMLTSTFDLEYYQDSIVEQTAFGQGKTKISPLQIAMIMQSVVNDGSMLKPHMISEIIDDENTVQKSRTEELTQATSKKTAKKLKKYLNEVAVDYGFDKETYGEVFAKTGTAEVSSGDYTHIYLVFSDKNFTGIISLDKSYEISNTLVEKAMRILDYLNKNM